MPPYDLLLFMQTACHPRDMCRQNSNHKPTIAALKLAGSDSTMLCHFHYKS